MRKAKDNLLPLMMMLLIPIVNVIYEVLNNSKRGVHNIVTTFDSVVPFMKEFIIPYMIWYPFIVLVLIYLCINCRKVYYKVLSSYIIGILLCYVVYFFFQTTVPRPTLSGNDVFTTLVKFIYNSDNPFNCFPSIHVLTSYLMMIGIRKSESKNLLIKYSINFTSLLIIVSTQFTKQHVILDLIFAIILAELVYKIVDKIVDKFNFERYSLWIKKPSWLLTTKRKLEI